MPATPPAELVDANVAAQRLGISKNTLYTLVKRGTSPVEPLRVGEKLLRFRSADLDRFIATGSTR